MYDNNIPEKNKATEGSKGAIFSKRLKSVRTNMGFTQQSLADQINILAKQKGIDMPPLQAQVVSTWERGHFPRQQKMELLAEVLNVPIDYLMVRNSSRGSLLRSFALYDKVNRITEDQLKLFGNEPVFYIPEGCDEISGEWGILSEDSDYLVTVSNGTLKIKNISGTFFTLRPCPEEPVISLAGAKKMKQVYIMPICVEKSVQEILRGWYSYDQKNKLFVKLDKSFSFPVNMYGDKYLGYEDIPKSFF